MAAQSSIVANFCTNPGRADPLKSSIHPSDASYPSGFVVDLRPNFARLTTLEISNFLTTMPPQLSLQLYYTTEVKTSQGALTINAAAAEQRECTRAASPPPRSEMLPLYID